MSGDKPMVTQRARDAAAALIRQVEHRTEYLPEIEDGSYDDNYFVQAFARFEQETREQSRDVGLPRLDEGLIIAALHGHYGKTHLGIDGVDLTANDRNWSFREGFKRMWAGVRAELKRRAAFAPPAPEQPLDTLQRLGQEFEQPSLDRRLAEAVSMISPPENVVSLTRERFKRDTNPNNHAPRAALEQALGAMNEMQDGKRVTHCIVLFAIETDDGLCGTRFIQAGSADHHGQMGLIAEAQCLLREAE